MGGGGQCIATAHCTALCAAPGTALYTSILTVSTSLMSSCVFIFFTCLVLPDRMHDDRKIRTPKMQINMSSFRERGKGEGRREREKETHTARIYVQVYVNVGSRHISHIHVSLDDTRG